MSTRSQLTKDLNGKWDWFTTIIFGIFCLLCLKCLRYFGPQPESDETNRNPNPITVRPVFNAEFPFSLTLIWCVRHAMIRECRMSMAMTCSMESRLVILDGIIPFLYGC